MRRNDPNETFDIHSRKLLLTRCHQLHSDSLLLDVWREMIWLSHRHASIYIIFMYLKTIMILLFNKQASFFLLLNSSSNFAIIEYWFSGTQRQFLENIFLACLPPRIFDHLKNGVIVHPKFSGAFLLISTVKILKYV